MYLREGSHENHAEGKSFVLLGSVSFLIEIDVCTYQGELPPDKKLKTTFGTVKHPSSF